MSELSKIAYRAVHAELEGYRGANGPTDYGTALQASPEEWAKRILPEAWLMRTESECDFRRYVLAILAKELPERRNRWAKGIN